IDRHLRIDLLGVPAERLHGVAHGGEVDHRRHAGEILHQHARRAESELALRRLGLEPFGDRLDVVLGHRAPVFVAQQIFQKNFHRERQARYALEAVSLRDGKAEIGGSLTTNLEGLATSEAVEGSHVGCFHSRPGTSAVDRSKLLARRGFSRWQDLCPNSISVTRQVRAYKVFSRPTPYLPEMFQKMRRISRVSRTITPGPRPAVRLRRA